VQVTPAGWPTNIDDLAWELYNYTLAVGQAFQAAGIQPKIASIGNEITAGMLFPLGSNSKNFVNLARLLHSASSGLRDSGLSPQPLIMTHLDNGWDWGTQMWWYENVLAEGTFLLSDFDAIGLSYYPFYNSDATLAAMTMSLSELASTYPGKALIVAETDWPESCPKPSEKFPSDTKSIPISVAGQTTWIQDVAALLQKTPGGAGLFYWEPSWIGNAGLGSSCADNLLVDSTGTVRSSMSVFASI
jgi:arabinogalactan endo-1,4-beta-galactosidase